MIRTPEHLIIHTPKGGGHTIEAAARHHYGPGNVHLLIGMHQPISKAPPDHGLVTAGPVRLAAPWYVSVYAYALSGMRARRWQPAVAAYGRGSMRWRDFLWGVTHPADLEALPDRVGVIWKPVCDDPAAELRASGVGLCSWVHRHMLGLGAGGAVDVALRTHCLTEDLRDRLGITGPARQDNPRTDQRDGFIGPAVGPDRWPDWYDAETLGWVEQADGAHDAWVEAGASVPFR